MPTPKVGLDAQLVEGSDQAESFKPPKGTVLRLQKVTYVRRLQRNQMRA
jgi:hypothetical protein